MLCVRPKNFQKHFVNDCWYFVLPCICARRGVESHEGVTMADGV